MTRAIAQKRGVKYFLRLRYLADFARFSKLKKQYYFKFLIKKFDAEISPRVAL